jgi:hypothetical protein
VHLTPQFLQLPQAVSKRVPVANVDVCALAIPCGADRCSPWRASTAGVLHGPVCTTSSSSNLAAEIFWVIPAQVERSKVPPDPHHTRAMRSRACP